MDGKRPSVRRRRQIKRTPGSHRTDHLFEPRLVGGGADERLETDLDLVDIATGASRTPGQIGQHLLVDVLRRHHRMQPDAVGTLPRHRRHIRTNHRDMNRNVGMVDGSRVKQRHHQVEVVMIALKLQRHLLLPAPPHRPHRPDVVTHPGCRRMPLEAVATPDVSPNLGSETEQEAPFGEFRQRPGRHRRHRRAPRKGHRHRRAELDPFGRRSSERHHLEGIILGLLHEHCVESDLLSNSGKLPEFANVEGCVGLTKPRVELAEREQ